MSSLVSMDTASADRAQSRKAVASYRAFYDSVMDQIDRAAAEPEPETEPETEPKPRKRRKPRARTGPHMRVRWTGSRSAHTQDLVLTGAKPGKLRIDTRVRFRCIRKGLRQKDGTMLQLWGYTTPRLSAYMVVWCDDSGPAGDIYACVDMLYPEIEDAHARFNEHVDRLKGPRRICKGYSRGKVNRKRKKRRKGRRRKPVIVRR